MQIYRLPRYQPPPSPHEAAPLGHRPCTAEPPPRTPVSEHPGYGPPRDPGQYSPESAHSRLDDISALTRSPNETHQMQHRSSNGHEYSSHRRSVDYGRGRLSYDEARSHGIAGSDVSEIHGQQGMLSTPYGGLLSGSAGPISAHYDPYAYLHPTADQMRRRFRAALACDNCRGRKARCDEGRPTCSYCRENHQICVYRDLPSKQDTTNTQILEKLEQMDGHIIDSLSEQRNHAKHIDEEISQLKAMVYKIVTHSDATGTGSHTRGGDSVQRQLEENNRVSSELSLPIGHTTPAHNLLDWDAVKALLPAKIGSNYVMKGEEDRGLIQIYGRGEGSDRNDGGSGRTGSSYSSEGSRSEEQMGSLQAAPSPMPSEGPWWATSFDAKQTLSSEPNSNWGGLNPNGTMDFHQKTVEKCHVDYMINIHIMHPFLDRRVLLKMVDRFISKYSPVAGSSNKGTKRKRVPDGMAVPMQDILSNNHNFETTHINRALPERTIGNAIVLLVLALGKICQWKDNLPGPTPSSPPADRDRAQTRSVTRSKHVQTDSLPKSFMPSPATSSLPSPNVVASSPTGMTISQPYSSDQHPGSERRELEKNIEVIPGMAYYAYATDILGNTQGGNDIPHVQAALLAGLYTGQLAHPFSSHAWITQACRACQVLIRPANLAIETNDARRDLILFAFWTCLQLESDILAELDLPASGISRYESFEKVSLPRGVSLDVLPEIKHADTLNMLYYSAQVQLRKILNQTHKELYKEDEADVIEKGPPFILIEFLNGELEDWRKRLPDPLNWKDTDLPPSKINAARLQAKYYGAKYIIHRPLLRYALHRPGLLTSTPGNTNSLLSKSPSIRSGQYSVQRSPLAEHNPIRPFSRCLSKMSSPRPQGFSLESLDCKVWKASEVCIQAAMKSTTALDGIQGRLIVTNIFGTAHAQFGNLLVLAATYNSHLGKMVKKKKLLSLLDRTINFLQRHANISPTLKEDAQILTDVRIKLFGTSITTEPSRMVKPGPTTALGSGDSAQLSTASNANAAKPAEMGGEERRWFSQPITGITTERRPFLASDSRQSSELWWWNEIKGKEAER